MLWYLSITNYFQLMFVDLLCFHTYYNCYTVQWLAFLFTHQTYFCYEADAVWRAFYRLTQFLHQRYVWDIYISYSHLQMEKLKSWNTEISFFKVIARLWTQAIWLLNALNLLHPPSPHLFPPDVQSCPPTFFFSFARLTLSLCHWPNIFYFLWNLLNLFSRSGSCLCPGWLVGVGMAT